MKISEALEAQYNARAAVPEHPEIFACWEKRSEIFRAQADCRLNLAYGPGEREKLDLFLAGTAHSPLHVFLHGGYWQAMDKAYFSFIAEALVEKGVNVAVLNYSLCPAVSLDRIVHGVRQACAWLWRRGAEFAIDRERIQVSGHSAGGHLTAMLIATDWRRLGSELPAALVKSGVAISGLFDLAPLRYTSINGALGLNDEAARRNSPMFLKPKTNGPLLLAVGERESAGFHRQTHDFAAAWRRERVAVETLELSGCNHFTAVEQLVNPDNSLFKAVLGM